MWDVLFYEGAKVLFHVALAIFKVPSDLSFYYDTLFFQNTVLVHDLEAHINSFSSYLSIISGHRKHMIKLGYKFCFKQ